MTFSSLCIKRPVFTIVLSLIVLVLGAVSYTKLQIRDTPNIMPPIVSVEAIYPGADALYMEKQITTRIEKVLKNVKNLDSMSSASKLGSSVITLLFKLDADIEIALNDVRSKIADLNTIFPDDMKQPSVSKLDLDSWPSMWISINSDRHDNLELTRIADEYIKSELERLPSVGSSIIFGGRNYVMKIEPDNAGLFQHKISPFEIEYAIINQNKDYPAGTIKSDSRNFSLRLNASLNNTKEFGNIIIKKYQDGTVIKLRDIARISLEPLETNVILRYNGKRSIAIGLIKQSTANIIELSNNARKELGKIKKNLPAGVQIEIAHDIAIPLKESIKEVFYTIFEAVILVGLVTYIFLASATITLIPLVTIPISLIGTFAAMYFCGFSINIFTLLAMILAIGLVVDDAIVMLENIVRHKNEFGKTSMQAAYDGANEIGFAVIAMTITLASVFLPVGLIEGFLGKLFIEFAWTLAFCVLFSGFVALTLTPMMTSRMIGDVEHKKPRILQSFDLYFNILQAKYVDYLGVAIENKKRFFAICSSSVILLIISVNYIPKIFAPEEDQAFLQVFFSGPEGSSVKESEKSVLRAEEIMQKDKDIFGFFAVIGWGGGESGMAFVPLTEWSKRKRSHQDIKGDLNAQFSKIPGMSIFAVSPRSLGSGGSEKMVEFDLQSSLTYEELDILSNNFIDQMKQNSIFQNVERDFKSSTPTIDILVNRENAYRYGANLETIGRTVQYLIAGRTVGDFRMGNDIYNVMLQYPEAQRTNPDDLKRILIKTDNNNIVPLESVAKIIEKITVQEYRHYNTAKSITITSDLSSGASLADAVNAVDQIAKNALNKDNTKIGYLGQIKQMQDSTNSIIVIFGFAMIFIFLILAAQFESFLDAILILLVVPFSITGGVLGLYLSGDTINMYSNIGLVTLIGLITKNSIMIVEFANHLREKGAEIQDAALESAKLRLRPILMTSIATVCGAMPLVFATGAGAAARNSIGIVIVYGMTIGTLFTIFVIPVMYQTFKKKISLQP